jgi:hypothetical protein
MENIEQAQVVGENITGGAEAQQEQAAPQLTIVDLQNLRAIVDTAVRRGAFGGSELTSVGGAFDRLNNFLNSVAPTTPDQPSA